MRHILLAAFISMSIAGCITPPAPQPTPLELQSLQQREFPAEKEVSFAATVSVFQDLGYIVDAADFDTGLITATSATRKSSQTRATAFVEKLGDEASLVRLNFVWGTEKNRYNWVPGSTPGSIGSFAYAGSVKNDTPILDPEVYQAAFERIESAIFVRQ